MEAELRDILRAALERDTPGEQVGLATAICRRFAPLGGVELPPHPDAPAREPPDFSGPKAA